MVGGEVKEEKVLDAIKVPFCEFSLMFSIGTCEGLWRNRNQKIKGWREDKEDKSLEVSQGPMCSGDWQTHWIRKTNHLRTISFHQVHTRTPGHAGIISGLCPLVCTQEISGFLTWTKTTGPQDHHTSDEEKSPPRGFTKRNAETSGASMRPKIWLNWSPNHISQEYVHVLGESHQLITGAPPWPKRTLRNMVVVYILHHLRGKRI